MDEEPNVAVSSGASEHIRKKGASKARTFDSTSDSSGVDTGLTIEKKSKDHKLSAGRANKNDHNREKKKFKMHASRAESHRRSEGDSEGATEGDSNKDSLTVGESVVTRQMKLNLDAWGKKFLTRCALQCTI